MEREATLPAYVEGSECSAIMVEVNDSRGNLVDILFYCRDRDCAEDIDLTGVLPWPAYPFSPDYDVACETCHRIINRDTLRRFG